MDLISFVPGIGPTGSFTPGVNTPAPFNVSHTGVTNGTGPTTATNNQAEMYNRLLLQIASTISASGIPVDNSNWAQLPAAVQALALSATDSTYVKVSQYNTDFTHLLADNGYQEFPGGRIEQECDVVATVADGEVTVTYPIAFPTSSKWPLVSVVDPARVGDESNFLGASIISKSNSGCVVALGQNGGGSRTITLHVEVTGY